MGASELLRYIETDNTLETLLHNPKREDLLQKGLLGELYNSHEPSLDFIGTCYGEGYENLSLFVFYDHDETYVLLRDIGDGRYEFHKTVDYNDVSAIPVSMSDDALELKHYIEIDSTMDIVPMRNRLECYGHCAKYYRLWLFQYNTAFVLLGDLGNGHYKFYKEVLDLTDAPVDDGEEDS